MMKKSVVCISLILISFLASGKTIKIQKGDFEPNEKSLQTYTCPDWFRDAKFGIIAHFGPQCAPEQGDWYAKKMYEQFDKNLQPSKAYSYHINTYGHPSEFGFKDVINTWKAEKWDPDYLVKLYKKAGAKYFVAMANHHDNFDMYDSKYQPWNSVNMGPKKDLMAGWAKAARDNDLRFGVSNHSAHAWHWNQHAYAYDVSGTKKGVRYDGWMTKADGKGKWWEGYDPQDLYGGNYFAPPAGFQTKEEMDAWYKSNDGWFENIPEKDKGYSLKWFLRCKELVDKYKPDLLYFDDTGLPLEKYGLNIAAHFYNSNKQWHNGKLEGVINAKKMDATQRKMVVLDIERSKSDIADPMPWQTDDCIGDWHYRKNMKYKSADFVIKNLVDIVSKNGNLLLSIPIKSDGTIDDIEISTLKLIGGWFATNGEAIYETRPWYISTDGAEAEKSEVIMEADGEVKRKDTKPMTADDIRFTEKNGVLYAFLLGVPSHDIVIKSLGLKSKFSKRICSISQLGSPEIIKWIQKDNELFIQTPVSSVDKFTCCFKIVMN